MNNLVCLLCWTSSGTLFFLNPELWFRWWYGRFGIRPQSQPPVFWNDERNGDFSGAHWSCVYIACLCCDPIGLASSPSNVCVCVCVRVCVRVCVCVWWAVWGLNCGHMDFIRPLPSACWPHVGRKFTWVVWKHVLGLTRQTCPRLSKISHIYLFTPSTLQQLLVAVKFSSSLLQAWHMYTDFQAGSLYLYINAQLTASLVNGAPNDIVSCSKLRQMHTCMFSGVQDSDPFFTTSLPVITTRAHIGEAADRSLCKCGWSWRMYHLTFWKSHNCTLLIYGGCNLLPTICWN
jgi:hypothetical protein